MCILETLTSCHLIRTRHVIISWENAFLSRKYLDQVRDAFPTLALTSLSPFLSFLFPLVSFPFSSLSNTCRVSHICFPFLMSCLRRPVLHSGPCALLSVSRCLTRPGLPAARAQCGRAMSPAHRSRPLVLGDALFNTWPFLMALSSSSRAGLFL